MFLASIGGSRRTGEVDRLSTGVEFLDEQIGGGIAPGQLVCLRTAPGSQGELLLRELATANEARYLSTTRTEDAVAEWLSADASAVDVEYVGIDGLAPRGGDAVRAWVEREADSSGGRAGAEPEGAAQIEAVAVAVRSLEGSVAVDPVNPLERGDESAYLQLLHQLQRRLRATGSLAFLHVVDAEAVPAGRWLTLQMADVVWDVSVDVRNLRVEFRLTVTKSRSDDVPNRQIKLELGRDVTVDTSREIA